MTNKLQEGQRVRLTQTLLDDTTDAHPVNLYEGDLGTVVGIRGQLGFQSDRWGDIVTFSRKLYGEIRPVLSFCEAIAVDDMAAQS